MGAYDIYGWEIRCFRASGEVALLQCDGRRGFAGCGARASAAACPAGPAGGLHRAPPVGQTFRGAWVACEPLGSHEDEPFPLASSVVGLTFFGLMALEAMTSVAQKLSRAGAGAQHVAPGKDLLPLPS